MYIYNDFYGWGLQELTENMVRRKTGMRLIAELIMNMNKLKPDTEFIDVPTVITFYLEWSSDLPGYGIEEIEWREHAAAYFKKGNLDASKGVAGTVKLLEEIEASEVGKLRKKTVKDPWVWAKRLKEYNNQHGTPKIGGTKYDITKMTRKERAEHAFDGKNPLADVSDKDLKEGLLDFA
jgi:hypothetical protein